jgi:D-xylonolactonase
MTPNGLEVVADYDCTIGEGPLWHPDEERLYWIDIAEGRLFRYDPATGDHERCYDGRTIGGFTLQADGSLLLFMDRGTVAVWEDGIVETVGAELPDERDSRFNDVVADPEGRVFAGTMPTHDPHRRRYPRDPHRGIPAVDDSNDHPNGMGFTPDREAMYLAVSDERRVYRYDYDRETGTLSDRKTFLATEGEDVPDGLTVDEEGFVWLARWNGHAVVRYAPDGTEVGRIETTVTRPSSIAFGGDDYADLYVTSARGVDEEPESDLAGALFRTSPGVSGRPEFRSRVLLDE